MTAKTKARKKTKVSRLLRYPGSAASFIYLASAHVTMLMISKQTKPLLRTAPSVRFPTSIGNTSVFVRNCRTSIARLGYVSRYNMYFTSSTKRRQERLVALLYKLLFYISIVVALSVLVQSGELK